MTPKDEGYRAAQDGLHVGYCPYMLMSGMSIKQHIEEGLAMKRNEWIGGWLAYHQGTLDDKFSGV